jgi:hypothetical protein
MPFSLNRLIFQTDRWMGFLELYYTKPTILIHQWFVIKNY